MTEMPSEMPHLLRSVVRRPFRTLITRVTTARKARHLALRPADELRAVPLLWGQEGWAGSPLSAEPEPFDLVVSVCLFVSLPDHAPKVCADLIAISDAHEDLLWTLLALTSTTQTEVLFAFKVCGWLFCVQSLSLSVVRDVLPFCIPPPGTAPPRTLPRRCLEAVVHLGYLMT